MNRYRHPFAGAVGRLCEAILNSDKLANARQAVMRRLPFLKLESDVTDVVYLTWMVDLEVARALSPAGVPLWQRDGKTPFTILTYRHGHFEPRWQRACLAERCAHRLRANGASPVHWLGRGCALPRVSTHRAGTRCTQQPACHSRN